MRYRNTLTPLRSYLRNANASERKSAALISTFTRLIGKGPIYRKAACSALRFFNFSKEQVRGLVKIRLLVLPRLREPGAGLNQLSVFGVFVFVRVSVLDNVVVRIGFFRVIVEIPNDFICFSFKRGHYARLQPLPVHTGTLDIVFDNIESPTPADLVRRVV